MLQIASATIGHGVDHYAQLLWTRDFAVVGYLQEKSRIWQHILDAPGRQESSQFSPLWCTVIVEIFNNKHIFNRDYPDYTILQNTFTIHNLLYVDHQFSSSKNNETSKACTH